MAEVVAPGSQATHDGAPHGTKRAAESSLDHEQRLSKRFDLLNLVDDNGTRLFYGVPSASQSSTKQPSSAPDVTLPRPKRPPRPQSDGMQIEDTPYKIYISDLAAELSDIESDEDTPIFLPDIEKHLSKIPRHLLRGPEPPKATKDNQMVLYSVPESLSVSREKDGVRKAIVEARRRIREGQGSSVGERLQGNVGDGNGSLDASASMITQAPGSGADDDDAMEID